MMCEGGEERQLFDIEIIANSCMTAGFKTSKQFWELI